MKLWTNTCLAVSLLTLLAVAATPSFLEASPEKVKCVTVSPGCSKTIVIDEAEWADATVGAWLGVQLQEITPGLREALDLETRDGVLVSDVVEDSPAEKAGLKAGDVIFKADDEGIGEANDLVEYVRRREPGEKIEIHYLREGKEKSEKVELGEREITARRALKFLQPFGLEHFELQDQPRLGVHVQKMDKNLAEYFSVKEGEGTLVVGVIDGSPAEEAGVKSGDVIVRVGDNEIEDASDIRKALRDYEPGEKARLEIIRKGKRKEIEVEIGDEPFFEFGLIDPDFKGRFEIPMIERHKDMPPEPMLWREEIKDLKKEMRRLRRELKELRRERESS